MSDPLSLAAAVAPFLAAAVAPFLAAAPILETAVGPTAPAATWPALLETIPIGTPSFEAVVDAALVVVSALCVLCGYRVIRGPTIPDRVVALDAIATNVVAIAVLFAIRTGRGLFVTVGLVLAIIGFVATVAVAKFVTEGEVIE